MLKRWSFPLFLPLVVAALCLAGGASAGIYLNVVGATQGTIAGDATESNHLNWINTHSFQHGIGVGIGLDGLPTGQPSLSDVTLTKMLDPSSIKLLTAILNQEPFTICTLDFVAGVGPTVYYRVELEEARISGYSQSSGGDRPSESLSLSYSKIKLMDLAQGTSVTYTRFPTGTAAIVPGQWEKGFLLPPSPNPTPGETQFRFSLPAGSDAELALFDTQGRRVRELHRGRTSASPMIAEWDGTDDRGKRVAPGVYLARLSTPGSVVTQRFSVVH